MIETTIPNGNNLITSPIILKTSNWH